MSRLIYILLAALSLPLGAVEVSDAEKVRRAIDNICGDTWCEGEYGYKFKKVIFEPELKQTRVLFTMSLSGWEPQVDSTSRFTSRLERTAFDVQCAIKDFSQASEILSDDHTVRWEFYMAMSDCVTSLENRLRGITQELF